MSVSTRLRDLSIRNKLVIAFAALVSTVRCPRRHHDPAVRRNGRQRAAPRDQLCDGHRLPRRHPAGGAELSCDIAAGDGAA